MPYPTHAPKVRRVGLSKFVLVNDHRTPIVHRHMVPRRRHRQIGGWRAVLSLHVKRVRDQDMEIFGWSAVVVEYLAEQVGAADPSCVKEYLERRSTRFEHQAEIVKEDGYTSFATCEAALP